MPAYSEAAAVRNGEVLALKKKKTRPEKGVDSVIGRIEETVRRLFKKMDASAWDFEGLCIGAPGAVDLATGIVRAAPNLDWLDVRNGCLALGGAPANLARPLDSPVG